MNKLLTVALTVPLMACVIGQDSDSGDDGTGGGSNGGSNGSGTGGGSGAADGYNHITAATSWTGAFAITKATVIDPGVTVTVPAGTTVTVADGAYITVKGTLDIQGTKGSEVSIAPTAAGKHHQGITVAAGGTLKMVYAHQTGGGVSTNGGTTTITDSIGDQAEGDWLVIGAGTVTVDHSTIGVEGAANSTHCNLHFGGSGTTIKINNSNIATSSYGLMLYGGNNVDLKNNNWIGNQIQIDTSPGVSGDITGSWFDNGAAPKAGSGATLTGTVVATRVTDAGPR